MAECPPPSYPSAGTFAELLRWHMDIWGTRPGGNTERSGVPWTIKEFAFAVHGDGLKLGSPERNVGNWREGILGPPRNRTTIQRIEAALFGDNPDLDGWKNDLRLARVRTQRGQIDGSRKLNGIGRSAPAKQNDLGHLHSPTPDRSSSLQSLWSHIAQFRKSVAYAGRASFDLPPLAQLNAREREQILSGIAESDRHWVSGPHEQGMLAYLWRRGAIDDSRNKFSVLEQYISGNRILWPDPIAIDLDQLTKKYSSFLAMFSGGLAIDDSFTCCLADIEGIIDRIESLIRDSILQR